MRATVPSLKSEKEEYLRDLGECVVQRGYGGTGRVRRRRKYITVKRGGRWYKRIGTGGSRERVVM